MEETTRIEKLADYLLPIVNSLMKLETNGINANMLSKNVGNFSLDKIPTATVVERWITGTEIHKDVFSLRSRNSYSSDRMNNLLNIGFFERFEKIIKSNNTNGDLPEIKGIQGIECLNCGTFNNANNNTAEFDIQIQITYKEE